MTGPSTFEQKWCAGYGVPGHLTDGGLIHILQPFAFMACTACWQRWRQVKELLDRKGTDRGQSRPQKETAEEGTS